MKGKNQKEMKSFEGKSMLKNFEELKKIEQLREKGERVLHFPKYPNEIKR